MKDLFNSIRTGLFLGVRQVKRASWWTSILITAVMLLTFLNLVFVSGILVGLIQGSVDGIKTQYTGDLIITRLPNRYYIHKSQKIISDIKRMPEVKSVTGRYLLNGTLESDYKSKFRQSDRQDEAGVVLVGINPEEENTVTNLKDLVTMGEYLKPGDEDSIVIGSFMLTKFSDYENFGLDTLDNVDVGTKIRFVVDGITKELTVKGILESKVDLVSRRAFVVDSLARKLSGRSDQNLGEIAVKLKDGVDPNVIKQRINALGTENYALVKTYQESLGSYIEDVIDTFTLLGSMFGGIGLVVAAITIFIVVFVNAITRRKYIGIMKGIGIDARALQFAYVFQAMIYAIIGSVVGFFLVYKIGIPYFEENPIDFPFSDGILVAPLDQTIIKIVLILLATVIAGYLPAKLITRQNTLDSILGR